MLIADDAEDERRSGPTQPMTPRERAVAARRIGEAAFRGRVVCGTCAAEVLAVVVEAAVETAVEAAERDLRARIEEQTRWPN